MGKIFSIFGVIFFSGLSSLVFAQTCPTDHDGLANYVSSHFIAQRGTISKSQVTYRDISTNDTVVYERTADAGEVTMTELSPPDTPTTRGQKEIISRDEHATAETRRAVELTTDNFTFHFSKDDQNFYIYNLFPINSSEAKYKKAQVWLDPQTCSIKHLNADVATGVPGLGIHVDTDFETINGVFLGQRTLFKYDWLHLAEGQVEAVSAYSAEDVIPPKKRWESESESAAR